jgi:salicylate hydroxylase
VRAIIIGAGIGGVAAAISLRAAGVEVTLLEQAPQFGEVGAGLQLAPNATRVLRRFGVLDQVAAVAGRPSGLSFRTWSTGAEICRYTLGPELEAEFGAPLLQVHRADLHAILVGALPPGCARLGVHVVGTGQDDRSAWVDTADGERLGADLVVAADGVRSQARQWLFGPDQALFSGTAAYRAVLPAAAVADLDLPENASWLGPRRHFVHYWLRGGELLNVVAVVASPERPESWTAQAGPGEAVREFAGWDPRLVTVLDRAGTVFRWGLYTRAPLVRWSVGRLTLLGDSAHAMVPFQAQGAAQAIADAAVLGLVLDGVSPDDVPVALERYVGRRLDAATGMQDRSAQAGHRFHLSDGPEADARNAAMAAHAAAHRFGAQAAVWAADVYSETADQGVVAP